MCRDSLQRHDGRSHTVSRPFLEFGSGCWVALWFLFSVRHSEHQASLSTLCLSHQSCVCDTLGTCSQESLTRYRVVATRSSSSTLRPGVCFGGCGVYFRVINLWGHRVGYVEKVLMKDCHCRPHTSQKAF